MDETTKLDTPTLIQGPIGLSQTRGEECNDPTTSRESGTRARQTNSTNDHIVCFCAQTNKSKG